MDKDIANDFQIIQSELSMTNDNPFLRIKQVQHQTGLARSTIYKLIAAGDFPFPVKPTPKCSAWVSSEVNDWKLCRMEERKLVH